MIVSLPIFNYKMQLALQVDNGLASDFLLCMPDFRFRSWYILTILVSTESHEPTLFRNQLVFESLVRSSYLVPRGSNRDRDRLAFIPKLQIT